MVDACAEGGSNIEVAQRVRLYLGTVGTWRARFVRDRLDGLTDDPRPGRPRMITDDQVEQVVVTTWETTPANATHWSTRSLAARTGMTQSAVSRIWRAFGLKPHRSTRSRSARIRCSWTVFVPHRPEPVRGQLSDDRLDRSQRQLIKQIRGDRILQEAVAVNATPLHLGEPAWIGYDGR